MAAVERSAAILLAAGLSRRFGRDDKLSAPFAGRPLIDHCAAALSGLPFARRIAVIRTGAPGLRERLAGHGFAIVENDRPEEGMARSIRLAMAAAGEVEAVVVALADMPRIPAAHLERLCLAVAPGSPVVGSEAPAGRFVPAAFAASVFPRLLALSGDSGARHLLAGGAGIAIDPRLLVDIDTDEDRLRFDHAPGQPGDR